MCSTDVRLGLARRENKKATARVAFLSAWWRRRDSGSAFFNAAWTMPSSDHMLSDWMRSVLFAFANPSARSFVARISVPMSLYRAGKVGPSLPLGVAMPFFSEWRQGSPNEPRFHSALASRGDHCVNRTRVRKPYITGSTCVVCLLFDAPPSGRQGDDALSLLGFNAVSTGTSRRGPEESTPQSRLTGAAWVRG